MAWRRQTGILNFWSSSLLVFGLAFGCLPAIAQTDAQMREMIVRESVAAYLATGQPCACPYSAMRNGAACGGRSAYSKPGGSSPMCYPVDVPEAMVAARRGRR